jgi:hypothetical protein
MFWLALGAAGLLACSNDNGGTSSSVAGASTATVFQVTLDGQSTVDELAGGGSLTITIAANDSTTGELTVLPAEGVSGEPATYSMAGLAVVSGSTVQFHQDADTFVRDLTWTVSGSTIAVHNQALDGATFTITLTKH